MHGVVRVASSVPTSPSSRRGGAFTLIELLVVVAVITILASLLMPTILSSMKSAQSSQCQSSLRQIHTAMMHYAKGSGMLIVPLGNYTTMSPHFDWWPITLEPYHRDAKVYTCSAMANAAIGYGQNYRVIGGCTEALSLFIYPQPLALVRKPSMSFIFADGGYVINPDEHANDWVQGMDPYTSPQVFNNYRGYIRFPLDVVHERSGYYMSYHTDPYRPLPRHPGHKTNCVFFDGHVAGMPTWDMVDEEYGEPNCVYDNQ